MALIRQRELGSCSDMLLASCPLLLDMQVIVRFLVLEVQRLDYLHIKHYAAYGPWDTATTITTRISSLAISAAQLNVFIPGPEHAEVPSATAPAAAPPARAPPIPAQTRPPDRGSCVLSCRR
jgi:hypothetical protein